MPTEERSRERGRFAAAVNDLPMKIQVGARNSKIAPDWVAIDLFDKSSLIDHNWDLHNLPLEDNSVDCFVCNAILEHVFEPQLAIFEMYRTLKIGGQIWVEVPFNQFYHAHPYDFRRWTVNGIDWEMRRFKKVSSGISNSITHEVKKIVHAINTESDAGPVDNSLVSIVENITDDYTGSARLLRLYSGVFFWGIKESHDIQNFEMEYMKFLSTQVQQMDTLR